MSPYSPRTPPAPSSPPWINYTAQNVWCLCSPLVPSCYGEFYALVNYISPPPGESYSSPKRTLCRVRSFPPPVSAAFPQPTLVCPGLKPPFPTPRSSARPLALAQLFDHRQMLLCFSWVSLSPFFFFGRFLKDSPSI